MLSSSNVVWSGDSSGLKGELTTGVELVEVVGWLYWGKDGGLKLPESKGETEAEAGPRITLFLLKLGVGAPEGAATGLLEFSG